MTVNLKMRRGDKVGWVVLALVVLFVGVALLGVNLRPSADHPVPAGPVGCPTSYGYTYPIPAGC